MSTYFNDIKDGIRSTIKGLQLTFRHFRNATERRKPLGVASDNYFEQANGLVTVQYPHEKLPIPDNGRYRLHNEIDDCIVCDKCAKVCPVDCITIEAIKATEEIGRASDGSPIRLYAGKFDIDMAKCCYCGLCTVVCPTECLTMEKTFDYSEFELGKLTYGFSNLSPEEADEKRKLYEQFVAEKEALKAQQLAAAVATKPVATAAKIPQPDAPEAKPAPKRPLFKPSQKPPTPKATETTIDAGDIPVAGIPSTESPALLTTDKGVSTSGESNPPADTDNTVQPTDAGAPTPKPKPAFRPSMKPKAEAIPSIETTANPALEDTAVSASAQPAGETTATPKPKPKPAFRPSMKPKAAPEVTPEPSPLSENSLNVQAPVADMMPAVEEPVAPKPKPAFRPTMKPKTTPAAPTPEPEPEAADTGTIEPEQPQLQEDVAKPKPKPAFRPTMKPKPPTTE